MQQELPNIVFQTQMGYWGVSDSQKVYYLEVEYWNRDSIEVVINTCFEVYNDFRLISESCNNWLSYTYYLNNFVRGATAEQNQAMILINEFQFLRPNHIAYTVCITDPITISYPIWLYNRIEFYTKEGALIGEKHFY